MSKSKHSASGGTDRRVQRTHRLLRNALLELILERGWDSVSVQDVCSHADVGRSTFYVHFADKEDLLLSGFDELHELLRSQRNSGEPFSFFGGLLEHAADNVDLFRAVVGRQSGQQVQWRFRDVLVSLIGEELGAYKLPKHERDTLVSLIAGGFIDLMLTWLEAPKREPAAKLAERFMRYVAGALDVAQLQKP